MVDIDAKDHAAQSYITADKKLHRIIRFFPNYVYARTMFSGW